MGGVINIVSARPSRRTVELRAQYGNLTSPKFDFFGSDVWGKLGVAVEGSFFDTDGFPIVIEAERRPSPVNPGPGVDTKATVNFQNVSAKLDYTPRSGLNAFFRVGRFTEERDNAKVSTIDGHAGGELDALDVGERRRARAPARYERSAGAHLRRRGNVSQQLSGGAGAAAGSGASKRRTHDAQSARADRQRRRHGAMGARCRDPAFLQCGWRLPLGRWRQRGRCARRCREGRRLRCTACRAARNAASRHTCKTSSHRRASWC